MPWELFHLGTMSWEQCHEYVRKGYDIIEDLYSPRTASMDFVSELVRKRGKDNLQKFILFGLTIYIIRQIKAQEEEFETFNLKIVHRKNRTGFEEDKNFHVVLNSVIAGCYHVFKYLGSAAFSKAFKHMTCTLVWMFVSK